MNERIKELAEQAGCKVMDGEWYIPSATGLEKIVYTKGLGLEKFAELIVKECIKAYNDDGYQTDYEQDLKVLKHFGVEQ
jgi:hypothetical protein